MYRIFISNTARVGEQIEKTLFKEFPIDTWQEYKDYTRRNGKQN